MYQSEKFLTPVCIHVPVDALGFCAVGLLVFGYGHAPAGQHPLAIQCVSECDGLIRGVPDFSHDFFGCFA